jgi:hypothetical protein
LRGGMSIYMLPGPWSGKSGLGSGNLGLNSDERQGEGEFLVKVGKGNCGLYISKGVESGGDGCIHARLVLCVGGSGGIGRIFHCNVRRGLCRGTV